MLCWKTVSEGVISLDSALFPTATGTWHRRKQKVLLVVVCATSCCFLDCPDKKEVLGVYLEHSLVLVPYIADRRGRKGDTLQPQFSFVSAL